MRANTNAADGRNGYNLDRPVLRGCADDVRSLGKSSLIKYIHHRRWFSTNKQDGMYMPLIGQSGPAYRFDRLICPLAVYNKKWVVLNFCIPLWSFPKIFKIFPKMIILYQVHLRLFVLRANEYHWIYCMYPTNVNFYCNDM